MKKRSVWFPTLAAILLPVLAVAADAERGARNCQRLLDNHVYRCQVKASFGGKFTDCLRFTSPGAQSTKFDLSADRLPGQVLGCACRAGGSFARPQFNASNDYSCVTSGNGTGDELGIAFQGTVDELTSLTITQGRADNEFGDTFVFLCIFDPVCGIHGSPTRDSGNPYQE